MEVMIPIIRPTGSINRQIVIGIHRSRRYHNYFYLIDCDYNFFRIEESVYNELKELNYPVIENPKRKGV